MSVCGHMQISDTDTGFKKHLGTQALNASYYMEEFKGFLHKLKEPVAVRLQIPFCSANCMYPIQTKPLSTAPTPLCV